MCNAEFFLCSVVSVPGPPLKNAGASLADKVAFLRLASSYAERPARVEIIETHMSWVFLTDTLVYKLKKPVRSDFLDFSTIDARRRNCENEIRLNQRLAPDIYLGLVPLTQRGDGQLQLGAGGTVVDWLVKMRRLPAQRMLDAAIRGTTVEPEDVCRLARALSAFYQRAERVAVAPETYRQNIAEEVRANETHLHRPEYRLDQTQIEQLTRLQLDFVASRGALLAQRAREGRIVEAHGDLRPEHICLLPVPVVIDSLEFKFEFRIQDPADELAYLALECERLGNGMIGEQLLRHYQQATGDFLDDALIAFYKTFRACLRAKIAVWHIADAALNNPEHWLQRAREYLALAQHHSSPVLQI